VGRRSGLPGTGLAMTGDVHETALRMLARRALSARELSTRLVRRGFSPRQAAAEVRRLLGAGLVNDTALAESLAQAEVRRGRGRRAVVATLRRRGLTAAVARARELVPEEEERAGLARALTAASRRYPGWRQLPERRRKVVRYLLARGFDPRLVREAVAARRGDADDAVDVEPTAAEDLP